MFACDNCRRRDASVQRHLLPLPVSLPIPIHVALCIDCFATRVRGASDPLVSPCVVCRQRRKWMFAGPRVATKCAQAEPLDAFRCINHVVNDDLCPVVQFDAPRCTARAGDSAIVVNSVVPTVIAPVVNLPLMPMPDHWD